MPPNPDATFTKQKKRRRSSLFIDRPASIINDSTDAASGNDTSEGRLVNYITELKNCKRSWSVHEKKLKSQLNSNSLIKNQCREYEEVKNNYLDYLDEDDRTFMKQVSPLLEGSYEKKTHLIKEKIQFLSARCEEDKRLCSILFKNISLAHSHCIVHKVKELAGRDETEFNDVQDISINDDAPQILDCCSDLSDFEE